MIISTFLTKDDILEDYLRYDGNALIDSRDDYSEVLQWFIIASLLSWGTGKITIKVSKLMQQRSRYSDAIPNMDLKNPSCPITQK